VLSLFDEPNVKAPVFASKPQKVPTLSLKSQLLVASPNCKIQSNRLIEQVGMLRLNLFTTKTIVPSYMYSDGSSAIPVMAKPFAEVQPSSIV